MFFIECTNQNLWVQFSASNLLWVWSSLPYRAANDRWSKECHQKSAALKSYFKSNIYSLTVPETTMVQDAERKFAVLKGRSWTVFKAKVHNIRANERKKKQEYHSICIYICLVRCYYCFVFSIPSLTLYFANQ